MASQIVVCGKARELVPEVIDALNGSGPKPIAVTVGGTPIYFTEPTPALQRHEEKHVDQSVAFAPGWTRWLPRRVRAWIGFPAFSRAYTAEHNKVGYVLNRFEVEARAAE
jgi:hypothetical protein